MNQADKPENNLCKKFKLFSPQNAAPRSKNSSEICPPDFRQHPTLSGKPPATKKKVFSRHTTRTGKQKAVQPSVQDVPV